MIYNNQKHYNSGKILFFNFRKKRSHFIKKIISEIFKLKGSVNIVDLGGTENFWNIIDTEFLIEYKVKITLINLINYKIKNKKIFSQINQDFFKYDFVNNSFDLSFSNSVIEHLGDAKKIISFCNLHKNLSKYYYLQTPNKYFFIEPHFMFPFFNFMPKAFQLFILKNFNVGNFTKKNIGYALKELNQIRLLSKKDLEKYFPKENIVSEKIFFLNKSYIVSNFKY